MDSYWSAEDLRLGKLLLAASVIQSFTDNWTSAKARHEAMPTSRPHLTRSQNRHASMLAVHAHPVPEDQMEDDIEVDVLIRRKKLSDAWSIMKTCEADLWTDVCNLYSMIVAVEQDPSKFGGVADILEEVAEARTLLKNAELVSAVETIEAYNQEEWKQDQTPACVRRGSLLMVHEHHNDETPLDARMRHYEHADAWQKMKSCDKDQWARACNCHEEHNKYIIAKREKLDAACWILQDFDSKAWTNDNEHLRQKAKHAACLTVHAPSAPEDESKDPAHHTHRQRLLEAWETMKEADPMEWSNACKDHEQFVMAGTAGILRTHDATRNGIGNHAA
ncbi:hypothetical protein ACHAXR_008435 [Thalassiosira sp. AJA248-18]